MKTKIYKELILILAIFLAGVFAFSLLNIDKKVSSPALSIENEIKLSEYIEDYMTNQFTEINSVYTDSVLSVITKRLVSTLDSARYSYNFKIIESDQINAFATLGGKIYIHSALIEICESPEELAAVLAHEMGHIEKRHVVNKIVTELGIALITGVLTGGDAVVISEIMSKITSTSFSRKSEKEADNFGLNTLTKAKISKGYMAKIFRKLKEKSPKSFNIELLSTHPDLDKRIKSVFEFQQPENFSNEDYDIDWDNFKDKLNSEI